MIHAFCLVLLCAVVSSALHPLREDPRESFMSQTRGLLSSNEEVCRPLLVQTDLPAASSLTTACDSFAMSLAYVLCLMFEGLWQMWTIVCCLAELHLSRQHYL